MKKIRLDSTSRRVAEDYLADPARRKAEAYGAVFSTGTPASIRTGATEFFKRPDVQAYLEMRGDQMQARNDTTLDKWVHSAAQAAFADPKELQGSDGKLLPLKDLPEDIRLAIEDVHFHDAVGPDGVPVVKRYKLASKTSARDQLAKFLGAYERDNSQSNPFGSLASHLEPENMTPTEIARRILYAINHSAQDTDGAPVDAGVPDYLE